MIDVAHIERARAVRIEDEIARRGITLRGRIDRCGPCPVCGGDDRFSINVKKQVFNCRQCGARGGDAIALVQAIDGLGFKEAVATLAGFAHERTVCSIAKKPALAVKKCEEKDNVRKATWLWSRRDTITDDCPAGLYLRGRGGHQGAFPATLGYLPPNGKHPPAMIAAFGFCEEPEPGVIDPPADVTGVHITRLTPDGLKATNHKPKIMLGPMSGLPIVLAPANDLLAVDIAEGIEKGLLIQADTGAGMWAAGSASNMPALAAVLPAYVECVTIWADRDETGLRFSRDAARIIQARKIDVRIKGIPNAERLRHG